MEKENFLEYSYDERVKTSRDVLTEKLFKQALSEIEGDLKLLDHERFIKELSNKKKDEIAKIRDWTRAFNPIKILEDEIPPYAIPIIIIELPLGLGFATYSPLKPKRLIEILEKSLENYKNGSPTIIKNGDEQ